ncbi:MAG TPA: winged helix-turn-helix transcriptional regulator [Solirubrobacteraceae bacterium]|jgi:DNA-binding HxlR family transcriptional regulator|nr:winged helix-turn-helix transcriptional regulator [Solirubrobacteraceae bacterium]
MPKRFDQYCPIAHALSLVGERWALLIVRELLRGPKRYTDLSAGLPGIGTNVLATRLRELEAAGVVARRKLPPPAASTVYELTEYGAGLEEVLHAMARWGARSLGLPRHDEDLDPEWGLNAFRALLYPERARGLTATYVVRVDDGVFTVRLDDGRLTTEVGAADAADADMAMDMATFYGLASGELPAPEALGDGRLRLEGDAGAAVRFFDIFTFAPRLEAPPASDGRLGPRVAPAAARG